MPLCTENTLCPLLHLRVSSSFCCGNWYRNMNKHWITDFSIGISLYTSPTVGQGKTDLFKSPTRCNNFPVYYPDVHLQLNMFRAFPRPSSGAQWLQWQPLVLPLYRDDSCAVFVVGPACPTTNTARLSSRYKGKTRGCHCSHWAPDDGRGNARNMFSCKWTSG